MNKIVEYNYFKSSEANKNFNFWINLDPESFHPLDLDRFTNMVIAVLDNDENLESSYIRQSKSRLEDCQIESYMEKYYAMKLIYIELNNRLRIVKI
jgi:hypothetical protein